ncbi:MAG: hypothetical protein IJP09_02055 [Clostridia bacterium]|nr:hypothetical protein [Clostridia bacterium]
MDNKEQNMSYQIIALITTPKSADIAAEMFRAKALPILYRFNAEGTASSEIMDLLGLGSIDKCMLVSVMLKPYAEHTLKKLNRELELSAVNGGIAFTMPLTGANNMLLRMIKGTQEPLIKTDRKDENTMSESKHALIASVVKRGFSSDVMDAARAAGARGGTVIHSRGVGNEEVSGLWGLSQDEVDIVLIITDAEEKVSLMKAISEKCGVHSEAKGVIMSLPIDSVTGF